MVPDYFVWAEQVYLSCIEDGVAADRSIVELGEVLAKSHIVVLRLGHSFPVTPEDNCNEVPAVPRIRNSGGERSIIPLD